MDDGDPRALLPSSKMSLREPPVHVRATFGLMGAMGVVINMILFVVDIITDYVLAYVLWRQASVDQRDTEPLTWFIITLCIIFVPMVVINVISLVWYYQNKQCLGDYCVLHKMTRCEIAIRIVMHLLLLGQLIRYVDMARYGTKMRRATKQLEMGEYGGGVVRRSPKGEVYAVLQMVISRDTAMLDMMHSFLQDAPQLVFQIFLLYRSPDIITSSNNFSSITIAVQVWKIVMGVTAISWALVSYQDELRRTVSNKDPLTCCGTTTCLLWRASMVASRAIAIASFTAIYPAEGITTMFNIHMREDGSVYIPFTIISLCVLLAHWLIMTAWIHSQGTTFCSNDDNSKRPVLELLYNCIMGIIHIFSYINVKDTPSRRRMAFYYIFCFIENTVMIAVWCTEMEPQYPGVWFRATIVFTVEILWLVGMCCIVAYYAFLHPDKENIGIHRNRASWRQ